jgi:hypothetical protein
MAHRSWRRTKCNLIAEASDQVRPIANIVLHCMSDDQCSERWDPAFCSSCQGWAVGSAEEILEFQKGIS